MIIDDPELPLTKRKITGPGVDALDNRKEQGAVRDVTTAELRASYVLVKDHVFAGLKKLFLAAASRINH